MDAEFGKWLATLGVGGVLAAFIYLAGRKDNARHEATIIQYTELWKAATEQFIGIIKENTASNAKLISLIETQERNALRKDDIVLLIDRRMQATTTQERLPQPHGTHRND